MDLLVAEGISVRVGGNAVLRSVDLRAAAGEIVGVFGPSGAGKSTLFRALAGEQAVASGRVWIGQEDISMMPLWERARRGLGYLPQTPSVLWDLTVAENIDVFRRLSRPARARGERDIIADLGLSERRGVAAKALSGGERRRLELARALCASPRVLLCDEPFAAVDPSGASKIAAALARLAASGSSVIVADHRVAEALRLCHRAALLVDGAIALTATPDVFRRHELVQKHYSIADAS